MAEAIDASATGQAARVIDLSRQRHGAAMRLLRLVRMVAVDVGPAQVGQQFDAHRIIRLMQRNGFQQQGDRRLARACGIAIAAFEADGGLGKQRGQAVISRQLGRFLIRGARRIAGADRHLDLAQAQQQAAALRRVLGEVLLLQVQRQPVQAHGLLEGEQLRRMLGRASGIVQRLRGGARPGLAEVVGQLRQRHRVVGAMALLQQLADAQVQPRAAQAQHLVVQRLADQRVAEAELVALRHRFDQVHGQRLFERVEHLVFRLVGLPAAPAAPGRSCGRCTRRSTAAGWPRSTGGSGACR